MLKSYAKFILVLKLLFSLVFTIGLNIALSFADVTSLILIGISIPVIVIAITFTILKYKYTMSYSFMKNTEFDTIDIKSGIFITRTEMYPIRRIQNIGFSQSFIQKKFKLSTIKMVNGGEEASILYIPIEQAQKLIEEITTVINRKLDEE